jgi:hypothetical protein
MRANSLIGFVIAAFYAQLCLPPLALLCIIDFMSAAYKDNGYGTCLNRWSPHALAMR